MPWLLLLCAYVEGLVYVFGVLVYFLCALCSCSEQLHRAQSTKHKGETKMHRDSEVRVLKLDVSSFLRTQQSKCLTPLTTEREKIQFPKSCILLKN
jgi:hypothetical protein